MSSDSIAALYLNASASFLSAVASLVQVVVFSYFGVKRYALFVALFVFQFLYNLLSVINCLILTRDETYLTMGYKLSQPIKYLNLVYGLFATSSNMTLCHICLNIWLLLQFPDRFYTKHAEQIYIGYNIFSLLVGFVDVIAYLLPCANCKKTVIGNGYTFSLFYVVIVGGFSLIIALVLLLRNRVECLKLLNQSSITASLLYRILSGFSILILIGGFNLSITTAGFNDDASAPQMADALFSSVGLATSLLLGTSSQCLSLWRDWMNHYFGLNWKRNNQNDTTAHLSTVTTQS